jgi:hypothetical protein
MVLCNSDNVMAVMGANVCEGVNMGGCRWLGVTAEIYGIIYDGEYIVVNV